jgi:biofilm PGA synthesis protein PgaD
MIIENPKLQSKTLRTVWLAVTMFMWLVYVYLWLPLISLLAWWFGYKTFKYHMVTLNGFLGLKSVFIGYFLVILGIGILLILWAKLEKFRFRHKKRRTGSRAVSHRAVAKHFNISEALLVSMQDEKIVTVEFNHHGEVADVVATNQSLPAHTINHT